MDACLLFVLCCLFLLWTQGLGMCVCMATPTQRLSCSLTADSHGSVPHALTQENKLQSRLDDWRDLQHTNTVKVKMDFFSKPHAGVPPQTALTTIIRTVHQDACPRLETECQLSPESMHRFSRTDLRGPRSERVLPPHHRKTK